MTTTPIEPIEPVRKTATVACAPDEAFTLFTDKIADWWPLATHSIGGNEATGVVVEPRVGGHIVESIADGRTEIWGTVTAWEPPSRLALTWHPGEPDSVATLVEVSFKPAGKATLVELVHSGWERRPDGAMWRERYHSGWDVVLSTFFDRLGIA